MFFYVYLFRKELKKNLQLRQLIQKMMKVMKNEDLVKYVNKQVLILAMRLVVKTVTTVINLVKVEVVKVNKYLKIDNLLINI